MTKLKNKKNRQRILSILLVFALVITGLFAFLSATDTKTNVFTIGNIKAELWEDFDIDKDGTITDGTNGDPDNVFGPETPQPPTVENILPGDTILKQPYVKNTGANEEWVYMIVAVPLEDKDDLVSTSDGSIALTANATDDVEERVLVTAVAVQDNFDGENTLSGIWGKLTAAGGMLDSSTYFGTASNDADLVPVFSINGLDTTNWTALPIGSTAAGQPFKSSNGYNYYAYGYSTKLAPKADNESVYPQTSALFQSVTLANAIGETLPVVVNYFAPVSSGSGSSGTGAGEADLSLFTPSIPGYELVHQDQVTPNSPITLYFDDSLAQTGKTFSWVDSETNKEAWTGMTVSGTTNLLANYNNRASASAMEQSYDWIQYTIGIGTAEEPRLTARVTGGYTTTADSYTAWANSQAGNNAEITLPTSVPITITGAKGNVQTISSSYMLSRSNGTPQYSFNTRTQFEPGNYDVPLVDVSVTGDLLDLVKIANIPDCVQHVTWARVGNNPADTLLETINVPYGCQTSGIFTSAVNMTSIYLPNSITEISPLAFKLTGITDINIPESVTKIGYRAFDGCSELTSLTIPKAVTNIGTNAFLGLESCEDIIVLCDNATVENGTMFNNMLSLKNVYWSIKDAGLIQYIHTDSSYDVEITLAHSVEIIPSNFFTTNFNTPPFVKYCGTDTEFALLTLYNDSRSVGEYISIPSVSDANITYNCVDPYVE